MKVKRVITIFLILGFLVLLAPAARAVEGSFFIGATGQTEDKPQSKLWFNGGTWWAILGDGEDIYFYKLENGVFVKQTFPHAMVDANIGTRADALWNGIHLFVLMYKGSTARLSKYTYNALAQAYTRLPGFPINILLASGAETAVMEQDSTGKLWLAYEAENQIRVVWSTNPEHTAWDTTGLVLYAPVDGDDIAAIVAFNNQIGVMWSNQLADNFAFRVHVDGDPETTWGPIEVVSQGNRISDDHINLAVTNTQDVLAATKASHDDEINLFVRWADTGWDGPYFISQNATRPIVVFEQGNEDVYVFYTGETASFASIKYKKANLSNLIDLALGDGFDFITVPGLNLNDVTSTKQAVDATTGLLVAAKGGDHAYYKSLEVAYGNLPPVASAGASVTSGTVPLAVQFTGSGTDPDGVIVAYAWNFGDGTTAAAQSPTHTYTAVGTYTAWLTVTDNAGATSAAPILITVTVSPSVNQPPVVNAGPDQTITLPASATLVGTVSDDGLPTPPGVVSLRWSKVSGPGTVTFANSAAASTTATFSNAGTYVLRLTANDGALTVNDDVTITVTASPLVNQPPAVNAGPDQTIAFPQAAALGGTVSDDGLPTGTLTLAWSQVSGPGTVTFTDPAAAATTATFSIAGTYVLRLTATDGALQASDEPMITVEAAGVTTIVETRIAASADDADETSYGSVKLTSSDLGLGGKTLGLRFPLVVPQGATIVGAYIQFTVKNPTTEPTTLTIEGEANDNVLPFTTKSWNITNRPRTLTAVTWAVPSWPTAGVTGLGQRTPDLATIIQEIVDRPGWTSGHALGFIITGSGNRRATTYDGSQAAAALLHVVYTQGVAGNQPPVVNAGPDQTIPFPQGATLAGTVSDDGLLAGTLTLAWSQVSGPGPVTFATPAAAATTATFSAPGAYVLRLSATDGTLTTSDELTVTVQAAGTTTVVETRIAASADDADETSYGSVKLTSSALGLGDKTLGLRFPLAVPQGATIVQAYVQFTAKEQDTVLTTATIAGEANDNALPFVSSSRNITNRPRTLAAVPWSLPAWTTAGAAGPAQRTPDLSAVIQELVNRPGWASGQALGLILTTSGTRHALSYDGSKTAAPLLHVEYMLAPASN